MEQDRLPVKITYREALDVMRTNSYYLNEILKEKFISFIQPLPMPSPLLPLRSNLLLTGSKKTSMNYRNSLITNLIDIRI